MHKDVLVELGAALLTTKTANGDRSAGLHTAASIDCISYAKVDRTRVFEFK
jgi:hypothetical protein